ncbi:hypothetical protein [Roseiflexus castenholzii]|uniref:hypothetical protein n=1 Tax=Roseiflexus castenholzii TaxID=120962 RepID=UPI003C7E26A1
MTDEEPRPACRLGVTAEDLAREADRAVLYGAILAAQRPGVKIKPHLLDAVAALLPAVRAYLDGEENDLSSYALEYARACGAEAFLKSKRKPSAPC